MAAAPCPTVERAVEVQVVVEVQELGGWVVVGLMTAGTNRLDGLDRTPCAPTSQCR